MRTRVGVMVKALAFYSTNIMAQVRFLDSTPQFYSECMSDEVVGSLHFQVAWFSPLIRNLKVIWITMQT